MTHSSSRQTDNERPVLPPISSMDGYFNNRNSSIAPPSPSPAPPWSNGNNTVIDEQSIQPQQQHRTSLPALGSPSPSTSTSNNTLLNHHHHHQLQHSSYHPRQHSLPQITSKSNSITATSSSSSSSSSSSPAIPLPSPSAVLSSGPLSAPPFMDTTTSNISMYQQQYDEQDEIRRRSSSSQEQTLSRIDNDVNEVIRHCHYLSDNMTQHKHQLLDQDYFCDSTKVRPWLDGMIGRANEVLNALLRLRKQQMTAEITRLHGSGNDGNSNDGDDHSLQDINQENDLTSTRSNKSSDGSYHTLRQKKRGRRSVFQGRCHSCNISETPEWRRGPDGARTLCNACGLHYAKLARKKAEQQKEQTKHGKRTTYDILVTDLSMQDYDSMRRPRRTHPQTSKPLSPDFDDNSDCPPSASSYNP